MDAIEVIKKALKEHSDLYNEYNTDYNNACEQRNYEKIDKFHRWRRDELMIVDVLEALLEKLK